MSIMDLSIEDMNDIGDLDIIKDIIKKRQEYFPKCLYHSFNNPLLVLSAKDQYYNNDVLDLYNNVTHIGHSNDNVLQTVQNSYKNVNINTRYLNEKLQEYAISLFKYITHLPKKYKVLFVNSGSEANDLALRLSLLYRYSINNKKFISLKDSYHGTTYLCNKVSYLYSNGETKNNINNENKNEIDNENDVIFIERNDIKDLDNIFSIPRNNMSSVIVECIQGVAGNYPLNTEFIQKLFSYADSNNIITICDEVQTGFGRTGDTFWGFEYYGICPDIITCGKSIANGYPMGAVIIREDLSDILGNFYFNTYGGNSVACSIAKTVLEEIENRDLIKNSKEIGQYLLNKLIEISENSKISDITGRGLFIGFSINDNNRAKDIVEELKNNKIIVGLGKNNRIRIKPPMIVNKSNIDYFISTLKKLLD